MIKRTVKETIKKYDQEGRLIEEWVTETTEDEWPGTTLQYPNINFGTGNIPADLYLHTTTANVNEAHATQEVAR